MRQTELTAQLCSIMRDVRNVRGNTQKKIEKLRQLLSGLLSELTNIEEVFQYKILFAFLIILMHLATEAYIYVFIISYHFHETTQVV